LGWLRQKATDDFRAVRTACLGIYTDGLGNPRTSANTRDSARLGKEKEAMSKIIGIDLGTTNSVVAVMQAASRW
jgi:hypothetical protein